MRDQSEITRRYDFLGKTRLYDFILDTFLLGRDLGYRKKLLNSNAVLPGSKVLDLGTGSGRSLPILSKLVGSVGMIDAIDISKGMLFRAEKRKTRHNKRRIF